VVATDERMSRTRTQSLPATVTIASIITVGFMGSVLVTPLYTLYQHKIGFSELTLTLIYAVYVVGNILALLVFGQISDQIGRKRAALPSLALAGLSALLFLFATRAVGVASGTGTAWLADEFGTDNRATATLSAATANLTGIALGPLIGGLLAQYAPWPLKLPFIVYMAILVLVAAALAAVRETPRGQRTNLRDVRVHPRAGVPRAQLAAFTAPAVTGFVTFALGGLYFALIPTVVVRDLHEKNVAVGGLIVFELAAIAAAFTVLARRLSPSVAMTSGLALLPPAVALVVAAQAAHSMPTLLIGTALAGVTMALGYRGSLQVVNEIAPADRRAEFASSYFFACFVGNSVPVIGIGVMSTLASPLVGSTVFAGVVAALAIGALAWRQFAELPA